ncbi:D-serine ammonia-lyase [Ureibacillus sinduriensis]|uniref:Probable D-serine dehydratase n=1 Tax=Ureibacillus sinduriensis BLB-1 = JCM 15800 TaxID=1384057 RepID=A0A0A3HSJ4_9BACL|nr:D-serine ammonia-lyase [Ureibacillus sinduriensis]KGR74190.1 serine ammonia-lyase [Ureibacillus sinduriensis BLB-1 = JCM 15800]
MKFEKQKLSKLIEKYDLLSDISMSNPVLWLNDHPMNQSTGEQFSFNEVIEAKERLQRFAPYLKAAFPETENFDGIIESEIKEIPFMKKWMEEITGDEYPGKLLLKCDYALPISGSIKARGGIHEVLKVAEKLAIENKLIKSNDDYIKFCDEAFRQFFNGYKIAVGSTGNLGLSIGIMGAKLGFQVTVHMSSEAKEWKKRLLREKGVEVIEYSSDYSKAVEEGRNQAALYPGCHFVDDENSKDLFAGYAVAALRLEQQLRDADIIVDASHPLFVYLPCGVGGGPGGVAYGLKKIYGEHIHLFFGEPTQSPCMLLGMMTGLHDGISVTDIGLTNQTEADGLAVGRASKFVGKLMEPILSGCYTVDDSFLFKSLKAMWELEQIFMEPSAHAAIFGPISLFSKGKSYMEQHKLHMENATHLIWSTGGNMVPEKQRQQFLKTDI